MRLDNANWKKYSKLITCVDDGYKIGTEKKKQDDVMIKFTNRPFDLPLIILAAKDAPSLFR
jgi:hypothetical protein